MLQNASSTGAEEEDEDEAFEGDTKEITQLKEAIRDVKKLQKNELEQETLSQEEVEDGEVRTRNVEYGEARMRNINRQDLMDNHAEIVAVSEGQGNQSELDLGLTLKRLNEILEIRKKLAEDRKKLAEDNINSYTDDEYSGMDYEDSDTDDKDSDTDENQKKALNAIKKGWGEDGYSDREEEYSDRDDANGLITDKRLTNEPLSEEQRWELRLLIRYKPKIKKMQRFFYQNIWINEEGKLRKKKPGTNSGSLKTVDSDGKDGLLRPRLKEYLYKIFNVKLAIRSRDERTGKTPCCRWGPVGPVGRGLLLPPVGPVGRGLLLPPVGPVGRGLLLPPVGPVGPVGPVVRGLLLLTVGLRSQVCLPLSLKN